MVNPQVVNIEEARYTGFTAYPPEILSSKTLPKLQNISEVRVDLSDQKTDKVELIDIFKEVNQRIRELQDDLQRIAEKFGLRIELSLDRQKNLFIVNFYDKTTKRLITSIPLFILIQVMFSHSLMRQALNAEMVSGNVIQEVA